MDKLLNNSNNDTDLTLIKSPVGTFLVEDSTERYLF